MPKVKLSGLHALITGASSGIGMETALELANAGCNVSVAARRKEELEAVAEKIRAKGKSAHVFPVDLSKPGAAAKLAAEVEQKAGPVDILMNNAGLGGTSTYFVEKPEKEVSDTAMINFVAPIELARKIFPGIVARNRGALISVSSGFGVLPAPSSSAYCASKAAIVMLDECLRLETAGSNVHILTVYPGPVDTPMLRATKASSPLGAQLGRLPTGDPKVCARKIREALENGKEHLFYPEVYGMVPYAKPVLERVARLGAPFVNRAREKRVKKKAG
ncbi:MAG: SDR family NAD(P)-dependent oxidoreductase [Bdellovibrionota bacterium]